MAARDTVRSSGAWKAPEKFQTLKHCIDQGCLSLGTHPNTLAPRWCSELAFKNPRSPVPLENSKLIHNYLKLKATLKRSPKEPSNSCSSRRVVSTQHCSGQHLPRVRHLIATPGFSLHPVRPARSHSLPWCLTSFIWEIEIINTYVTHVSGVLWGANCCGGTWKATWNAVNGRCSQNALFQGGGIMTLFLGLLLCKTIIATEENIA